MFNVQEKDMQNYQNDFKSEKVYHAQRIHIIVDAGSKNIKSLEIKLVPSTIAKTLVNDIFKFGIIKLKAYITFREQQLPEGQSESC